MMSNRELEYYDLFLNNKLRGQYFYLKLSNGKMLAGVPVAYRPINAKKPIFYINGSKFSLREVVDTKEVSVITVYATKQLDGYTCGFDPKSKAAIEAQLQKQVPFGNVFVSFNVRSNCDQLNSFAGKHIAVLLTGLPEKKLQALGKIAFVDSRTMEVLFEL